MATASGQLMGTIWLINGQAAPNSLVPYVDYEITTNVQNNSSQVKLTPWILTKNSDYWFYGASITGTVSLGGKSYQISGSYDNTNKTHTYLTSGTLTLPHNADGSLTANLSMSFTTNLSGDQWLMKRGQVTGTIQFPTIPRESRITSSANFTLGNALPVSIQRYSSNFTHTLSLSVGGSVIQTVSGVGTSTNITLTTGEVDTVCQLAAQQGKSSLPVVLKCTTYSGSIAIGSVTQVSGTCTIPLGTVSSDVSCTLGKDLTVQVGGSSLFTYEVGVYWENTLLASQSTSGGSVTFSFSESNLTLLSQKAANGQVALTVRCTSKRGTLTVGTTSKAGHALQKLAAINSAVGLVVGDGFPYAIQPAEDGFQYRLVWLVDGVGVLSRTIADLEGTILFTPEEELDLYEKLSNNAQHTLTLRCVTLAQGVDVGHTEKTGTIQVDPQRAAPTAPLFTYQDTRAQTIALTGNNQVLVQGQSTLKVAILPANRAVSNAGATIVRYVLYCGDTVKGEAPFQTDQTVEITASAPNSPELYVTAVDSRGNESPKISGERGHVTAQWVAYEPVQVGVPTLTRRNGVESKVSMDWKGYCWNGSFGQQANTLTMTYRFRSTLAESAWTEKTMTYVWKSNGEVVFEDRAEGEPPEKFLAGDLEGDGGFDVSKSFLLTVTAQDLLTQATSAQVELTTGIPPLYLDRGGIGVNKIREQGAVDVQGTVHTTGGLFKGTEEALYPSTLGPLVQELTANKVEKVSPAVTGNFPKLTAEGALADSGIPARLPTAVEVGAVSSAKPQWIFPELLTGSWPADQTAFQPCYAKSGNVVSLSGILNGWKIDNTLWYMPEGYRPERAVVGTAYAAGNWGTGSPTVYRITVGINGSVHINGSGGEHGTDWWLLFALTYLVAGE